MFRRFCCIVLTIIPCGATLGNPAAADDAAPPERRADIRVGIDEGDFRGEDGRVLQAAVDYVAGLGGGVVHIGPGRYLMRNTLILKSNVRLVGTEGKTLLVARAAHQSPLATSASINERQIRVTDPAGFQVGDGIIVQDDESMYGFFVTQATITAQRDEHTFAISRPLYHDYSLGRNARATTAFPIVGAWNSKDVEIIGLEIDGNGAKVPYLTGCRGGGIFLFECDVVTIRNCTVRNYNGDGISFQASRNVVIEDVLCEGNYGVGLHPGCGTQLAEVRRARCTDNRGDGLFLCVRVQHCLFEDNDFSGNQRHGISIGERDSDNRFVRNRVTANSKSGVQFRRQPPADGAHRNVFEENRIVDNGVCVRVDGHHQGLVFRKNTLGRTTPADVEEQALEVSGATPGLKLEDNELLNVKTFPKQ